MHRNHSYPLSLLIRNISGWASSSRRRAGGRGSGWRNVEIELDKWTCSSSRLGSEPERRDPRHWTAPRWRAKQQVGGSLPLQARRFAAWQATGQPWSLRVRHVNTKKKRSRRTHPHVNNHFIIRAELKSHAHIGTPYLFNVESSRTSHRDVILHSVISVEFWTKVRWDGCI